MPERPILFYSKSSIFSENHFSPNKTIVSGLIRSNYLHSVDLVHWLITPPVCLSDEEIPHNTGPLQMDEEPPAAGTLHSHLHKRLLN